MIPDVLVVGGGVVGLSIAYELSRRGSRVQVVDQGPLGREASWAGAGMLPPGRLRHASHPEAQLRGLACELWPDWVAAIREDSRQDSGYWRCGAIEVIRRDAETAETASSAGAPPAVVHAALSAPVPYSLAVHRQTAADYLNEGVSLEELDPRSIATRFPWLNADRLAAAHYLPDFAQIRNPWHLKSLMAACIRRGVVLSPGVAVTGWSRSGSRVTAAESTAGPLSAAKFVIASGAWSGRLLSAAGCSVTVLPVRGQIALLRAPFPVLPHVIEEGARYLVPRADGRVLVGSTLEQAGFDKSNTVSGITDLLNFASLWIPSLRNAPLEQTWAGLRPGSPREWPWLAAIPGSADLYVATGHFRSGLQMSPATARLMSQLVLGEPAAIPMSPFAVD